MMQFNIDRSTAPTFVPVTVTITVDSMPDLALLANLFGGVPVEATNPGIDALASALRGTCDASGIAKAYRKGATGFNWGKKLREALADAEG